jgi:AraC family ethanolamine operon transcriptional activator
MLEAPSATLSQFSTPPVTTSSCCWSTDFNSASELAASLSRLGKTFDALQLSPGPLEGHFSVVHLKDLSILSIQTNQLLLLNGERGHDCICFSLEISGNHNDHRVFCQEIEPYSLHGFKPDLSESHFQLTAGSTTLIAVASAKRFSRFLGHCGQLELLEHLHSSNSLQLQPNLYAKIIQQFSWYFSNPLINSELRSLHTGHIFTLMLEAFTGTNDQHFKSFEIAPRQHLVHELINWGFENSTNPLKLDDISNVLFSSRRTLIQGCKENFKMGPMELLRLIRLEQVNHVLRSNELRASLELKKVGDVANHFGFSSRGHFSAAYQSQYGETPRQTLSKAKH